MNKFLVQEYIELLKPLYMVAGVMFIPNLIPIFLAQYSFWFLCLLALTFPVSAATVYLGIKHNWFGGILNE